MKIDTLNEMIVKSKSKKDGIYSHKGNFYLVRGNHLTIYSDFKKIYQLYGNLSVKVAEVKDKYLIRDLLKKII